MYVRPFWSKTPRRESVRQGQCPRREHSSQFVPACGSVVGDHAEPRPTLGVIAIVRGGSRTADEHTAPGTLPRKLATRRAGSSSRTRLLRGRPAPPPSKPHSWAALVEREILEHGGGAGPMHPDRPRGGRDDEGIRSPAHTLLRCLASQPNRPRRTCNRIGGPALPRLRESPMCLPAARSAAACNRTRAVARVGGAATGADAPVAAGWDDNQPSQRRRQTAESTRRCRSQCESGTGPWIGASSETVAASGKQQPGVSAAGRSLRVSRRMLAGLHLRALS